MQNLVMFKTPSSSYINKGSIRVYDNECKKQVKKMPFTSTYSWETFEYQTVHEFSKIAVHDNKLLRINKDAIIYNEII